MMRKLQHKVVASLEPVRIEFCERPVCCLGGCGVHLAKRDNRCYEAIPVLGNVVWVVWVFRVDI